MSQRRPGDLPGDLADAEARIEAIERLLASGLPRILYGQVSSTGAVSITGSGGWTSTKNSTGNYTITFTIPFISNPSVVLTSIGGLVLRFQTAPGTASCNWTSYDSTFNLLDSGASFIAIGV